MTKLFLIVFTVLSFNAYAETAPISNITSRVTIYSVDEGAIVLDSKIDSMGRLWEAVIELPVTIESNISCFSPVKDAMFLNENRNNGTLELVNTCILAPVVKSGAWLQTSKPKAVKLAFKTMMMRPRPIKNPDGTTTQAKEATRVYKLLNSHRDETSFEIKVIYNFESDQTQIIAE